MVLEFLCDGLSHVKDIGWFTPLLLSLLFLFSV